MLKRKKTIIALIAIVVIVIAAALLLFVRPSVDGNISSENQSTESNDEQVAAIANGQNIYESDVTSYIEEFRKYAGCDTDEEWATYLDQAGVTPSDIRNNAIKHFAENIAVHDKANELGITVSEDELNDSINNQKIQAGYENNDEGWIAYLNQIGTDADTYRNDIELTMLEELLIRDQVPAQEVTEDSLIAYAESNIDDYTGKQIYQITYSRNASQKATEATNATQGMSLDEFIEYASNQVSSGNAESSTNIGWSCLAENDITSKISDTIEDMSVGDVANCEDDDGTFKVILVYGQFSANSNGLISINDMPDEIYNRLKSDTADYLNANSGDTYLEQLLNDALETTNDMPEGLSYDVDMSLSTYGDDADDTVSDEEIEQNAANQVNDIENAQ